MINNRCSHVHTTVPDESLDSNNVAKLLENECSVLNESTKEWYSKLF